MNASVRALAALAAVVCTVTATGSHAQAQVPAASLPACRVGNLRLHDGGANAGGGGSGRETYVIRNAGPACRIGTIVNAVLAGPGGARSAIQFPPHAGPMKQLALGHGAQASFDLLYMALDAHAKECPQTSAITVYLARTASGTPLRAPTAIAPCITWPVSALRLGLPANIT